MLGFFMDGRLYAKSDEPTDKAAMPTNNAIASADIWMAVVKVCIWVSPEKYSCGGRISLGHEGQGLDRHGERERRVGGDGDCRPFDHHCERPHCGLSSFILSALWSCGPAGCPLLMD